MIIAPKNLNGARRFLWLFRIRKSVILLLLVALAFGGLASFNTGGFPIVILILLLVPYSVVRLEWLEASSLNSLKLREILFVRKQVRSVGFGLVLGIVIYSIIYLPNWDVYLDELSLGYPNELLPLATHLHKSYGILVTAFVLLLDHFLVIISVEKSVKKVYFPSRSFSLKNGGFVNKQRGFDRDWVYKWDHTVNLEEYLAYLEERCENNFWWPSNDFFDPPDDWIESNG